MNLSLSDSTFRFCYTNHGNSKALKQFWQWCDTCNECAKPIQAPRDLFCKNFGSSCKSFPVCQNVWCSRCYRDLGFISFPRQLPENDEGVLWHKKKDENHFLEARKGDMLCAPFQCDFCWFINLKGRLFNEKSAEDRLNISLIRHVNLDMLWEKEPSMVAGLSSYSSSSTYWYHAIISNK